MTVPGKDTSSKIWKTRGRPSVTPCTLILTQSCLTLCDPVDCSPPGSSVHGILQARVLEWVAMPSSRGSSWLSNWTYISCVFCIAGGFFTTEPPGKPPVTPWWFNHLVTSNSLRPYGLSPAKFLCPWDFPGKNTRMGYNGLPFPFPGELPNPGIEPESIAGILLHCRHSLPNQPTGKPILTPYSVPIFNEMWPLVLP